MKAWGMIIFLGISRISNNNFVQGDTNTGDSICNHINDDKCFTYKSNRATLFFSFSNQDKGNTSSCLSALVSLRRDIRFKVYGSSLKTSFSKLYNKLKN